MVYRFLQEYYRRKSWVLYEISDGFRLCAAMVSGGRFNKPNVLDKFSHWFARSGMWANETAKFIERERSK